ncbi:MAG: prephenate dehydratase [Burkholderiaceae bacterium]|jgi:chorismate mutase/prephenate dehydratase|nr:prephenate dehydratase [Burkholderiaceae bacterium]
MDDRLQPLRTAIDAVDRQLIDLLNQRARLAMDVGRIKHEAGAPVYRPEREAEVLRKIGALNAGPLTEAGVTGIWREVMAACRALERPVNVAFLGPHGTFSELALQKQFGNAVVREPCASIDDVFRAVEAAGAEYGIVPVENSTEGSVTRTLDLLLATPLKIIAEVALPVHHNLLTLDGSMNGVKRICAHSQALAQCTEWLGHHYPDIERTPVSSNGEAARLASTDPSVAAVAGDIAAQRYGLMPVATHIQDDPQNRTRFVVLGRQDTTPQSPPARDKTSLILAVPNKAGAVFHMLAPLEQHGVSMTRFESRPARSGTWEYWFYVDVEGHEKDPKVARALEALREVCAFYKSLGSYPAAG